jgi:FkbM family methyltransferase
MAIDVGERLGMQDRNNFASRELADRTELQRDLIFDIGAHAGGDTAFYLAKGFRVVAVEPNPTLAAKLQITLAKAVDAGRLTIEPGGVMPDSGRHLFYLNLTNDLWSSFSKEHGTKQKSRFKELYVECKDLDYYFAKYGIPYYVKINAEGMDEKIIEKMRPGPTIPLFVSVAGVSVAAVERLFSLGYNMFSLRPQKDKSWAALTQPAREGVFVQWTFTEVDSGPFGLEAPGWSSADVAKRKCLDILAGEGEFAAAPKDEWYDLHATYWPHSLNGPKLDLA